MRWALAVLLLLAAASSGPGMDFDRASSEYIDMGVVAAHSLTSAHSVTLSFHSDDTSSYAFQNTFSRQDGVTGKTFGGYLWNGASPGFFDASNGGTSSASYQVNLTSSFTSSVDYHMALTFSSSTSATFYRDGSSVASDGTVAAADNAGDAHTMIAASWSSGAPTASYLDGSVHQAILHGVKMGAGEVLEEYTTGLPARIPVSWYRPDLNGPTGSTCSGTVYDESATAADGTCNNTPTFGEIPEGRTVR